MPSQNSFTPWWNSPRGEAPANRLRKGKKPLNFEEYASEGNRFVNEVARELNTDRNTAARILRVVLHAVRDRLPADDAIQFAQGLPIALKGVFIDQYDPSRTPVVIRNSTAFIDFIYEKAGRSAPMIFEDGNAVAKALSGVFTVLENNMDFGQVEQIKGLLHDDIVRLIERY